MDTGSLPSPGLTTVGSEVQVSAFNIAAADRMQLSVDVDERDILSLDVGQNAEVTLEAVNGEMFTGEIARINASGMVGGGSARYQVEIMLTRTENMLPGMSASAVVTTQELYDILLLPAEAIQEAFPRIYVYTGEEDGTLTNPVEVEIGLSDGMRVEVLSGLSPGDTVYFALPEVQDGFTWGGAFAPAPAG